MPFMARASIVQPAECVHAFWSVADSFDHRYNAIRSKLSNPTVLRGLAKLLSRAVPWSDKMAPPVLLATQPHINTCMLYQSCIMEMSMPSLITCAVKKRFT